MKSYIKSLISAITVFTALFFILTSCSSSAKEEHKHENDEHEGEETTVHFTEEQLKRAKITVAKPESHSIGAEIKVNGIIDVPPQNHVSLNIPYGGFLQKITVLPGSPVKKGQLLAVVSNPEFIQFQQDYLEALGKQEFLKEEFERQKTLNAEQVSSTKALQQAKSDFLINDATIKSSEARLKLIGFNPEKVKQGNISSSVSLYSSVNGSVREVLTNVGRYISPQDVILNLTDIDNLHVELVVYENDAKHVHVGQTILFSVANSMDKWREAEVFLVGSDVREDRSVTVHGHLKESQADLLPGMYVTALLKTDSEKVWALPEEAFVRHEGNLYVFQLTEEGTKGKAFEMIQVEEGVSRGGFTELKLADNQEGKIFATQGTFYLLAALKNTGDSGHSH